MASGVFQRFKWELGEKNIDMKDDTHKVILLKSSHVFTSTSTTLTSVSENQVSGTCTGYDTGGSTLSGLTWVRTGTTYVKWDGTDLSWNGATFTAAHAVIYNDTHASDIVVCSIDFGGDKTVSNGTFTIQWHANGIMRLG